MQAMDKEPPEKEMQEYTVYQKRKLRTLAMFSLFFCLGVATAMHGPLVVNLQELLQTDTVQISVAFSLIHAGFLSAAILCGVIFKRLDSEFQFSVMALGLAIAILAAPFSRDMCGFMAAYAAIGFTKGYIDTGGNTFMLLLWSGHRAKEPLFQAMHLTWTVGASVAPVIVKPFLVDANMNGTVCNGNASLFEESNNITDIEDTACEDLDYTSIRYAYVVISGMTFCVVVLYFALYCALGHHIVQTEKAQSISKSVTRSHDQSRCFRIGFYIIIAMFFYFLHTCENIGSSYLSYFVVGSVGWTVQEGATVTAVYWASSAAGRVLGIPVAYVVSPRVMLALSLSLVCLGNVALMFVHVLPAAAIYGAVVVSGLGMATVFPSMILWLSSILASANTLSSVAFTSAHTGSLINFLIVGSLLENFGYMVYAYVIGSSSIILLLIFIIMNVCARAGVISDREEVKFDPINPFEEDNA